MTDSKQSQREHEAGKAKDVGDSKTERMLNELVPPSRDTSDKDLKDPGRAEPNSPPVINKS